MPARIREAGSSLALAALALAAAVACGAPPQSKLAAAPSFELPDLSGGRLSLESLRGRVVVLDFWATWCGPCIREIPEYQEFWKENRDKGVEVVGVVFDSGSPEEIADFVREHEIPYRQLLGDDALLQRYEAQSGFPTTFVIDSEGLIRSRTLGSPPGKFARLQQTVDEALSPGQAH